jgi:hypothetical protein
MEVMRVMGVMEVMEVKEVMGVMEVMGTEGVGQAVERIGLVSGIPAFLIYIINPY